MAEGDDDDRTEPATPRRREEARKQGQVALSNELNTGAILLAGVLTLYYQGPRMAAVLTDTLRVYLHEPHCDDLGPEGIQYLFQGLFARGLDLLGGLLGVLFVAGVAAGVVQVGFYFTTEALTVKWEKLDPVAGLKRMFSLASGIRTLTSLLKLGAITILAYVIFRGRFGQVTTLSEGSLAGAVAQSWHITMRIGIAIAAALLVVGVVDYVLQRVRFERSLRMTKQELKEEIRREEGDPLIKGRIRRMQREAAQRRMLQEVPRSTVVLTNPTHVAVALLYERTTMPAPKVLAKGAGFVAKRIVESAREHGVPVLERPELARGLYKAAEVDREIPAGLYYAVAEVLAYLYRLRGETITPPPPR